MINPSAVSKLIDDKIKGLKNSVSSLEAQATSTENDSDAHISDTSNPHSVTAAQAGAASTAHVQDHLLNGSDQFLSTHFIDAVIRRIRTTTGPTDLQVGAIQEGEFIKRVGSTLVGGVAGGGGAGSAGVDEVVGRRYMPGTNYGLSPTNFVTVTDRLYAGFRPIPSGKTYAKISALFGPNGAAFPAGSQAYLAAYEHNAGQPGDKIAEILITDAILTGDKDVLADMVLSIPAVAPGIFLAVATDRPLGVSGHTFTEVSALQQLGTTIVPSVSPGATPGRIVFNGQAPLDNNYIFVDSGNNDAWKFIFKTTPGTGQGAEIHVQIDSQDNATTVLNLAAAMEIVWGTSPGINMVATRVSYGQGTNNAVEFSTDGQAAFRGQHAGGWYDQASSADEQTTPAVAARITPHFATYVDMGAFGPLPDPFGAGTLLSDANVAMPLIMLEP